MKKALIGIAVLLVLLIAGALVAPSFIDWNQYKGRITTWVERETGRDLTIAGDLSLSLLPAPALSASGVTFANAAQGSGDPMVRVENLEVRVAPGPLLSGEIRVESVRLVRPRMVLEVLPDGRGNWEMSRQANGVEGNAVGGDVPSAPGVPEAGDDLQHVQVALDSLVVEDGALLWRDAGGTEISLESIAGEIAADSLRGPFEGTLDASLRGARLSADLRTGRFASGDEAISVFLAIRLPEAGGQVEVRGRLAGLAGTAEGPTFTGDVAAESPSLSRTLAALNAIPAQPPLDRAFRLAGAVTASEEQVALDDMTLRLGETEGTGAVAGSFGGAPSIDVALAFTRIDLDTLLKKADLMPRAPVGPREQVREGIIPAAVTVAEGGEGIMPTQPAPSARDGGGLLARLPPELTGSIDVSADVVTWRGGVIRSARLNAMMSGGEATLNEARALLPGSSEVNVFGFLNTRSDPARIDGTAELKSSNLRALLAWLAVDTGDVPADRLRHFTATAAFSGTTDQVQVENLQGEVDLTAYQGAAAVRLAGKRPAFGLSLSLNNLNLDAYLAGGDDSLPAAPSGSAEQTAPTAPAPEVEAVAPHQAEPSPPSTAPPLFAGLGVLNTFDANVKARVGMLTWHETEVRDAYLDVSLLEGTATFGNTVVQQIAGATVSVGGGLSGFGGEPEFDGFRIAISSENPSGVSRLLGLTLPLDPEKLAPVALSATLNGPLSALSVRSSNQIAGGAFSADGTVLGATGDVPEFDMSVTAEHGNAVSLLRRLGVSYAPRAGNGFGPLELKTRATGTAEAVQLEDMTLRFGPSTFTGSVSVRPAEERPRVSATLTADRLPLDAFLPTDQTAALERLSPAEWRGGIVPAAMRSGPVAPTRDLALMPAQAGATPRWSREAIDLDGLNSADVDLALKADTLSFERWVLRSAELSAVLAGGRLEVPSLTGTLFGGPLDLSAALSRAGDGAAEVSLNTRLSGMDVGAALEALSGQRAARGRMDFTADVSTTGTSEYALVSALNGVGRLALSKLDMRQVEGDLKGSALAALLAPVRLLDRVGGGLGGESYGVDINGEFDLQQGVMRFADDKPLTLSSNLYNGSLSGTIALPAWTLDVGGEVQVSQNAVTELLGNVVSLPDVIPVSLRGSLDGPNVTIGTRSQSDGDADAAPTETEKPVDRARDAIRQLLDEEIGGAEKEQSPEQKPEKILRDTLKNMFRR